MHNKFLNLWKCHVLNFDLSSKKIVWTGFFCCGGNFVATKAAGN